MERLQKIIAESGFCSRRKAEEYIKLGKVFVNGEKVTELGTKASFGDYIVVDGKSLTKEEKVYFLLNKPRGYVSTVNDELGRKKITDLIETDKRVYPVGRLDYDTTGLIILTNDGELANILMHPSFQIEKTYIAKVEGILTGEEFQQLKKGINIEGRKLIPKRVKLRLKNKAKNFSKIEITIMEGRNHIVKKAFDAINHPVKELKRETFAFLTLEGMKKGEYRPLTIKEIKKLYALK